MARLLRRAPILARRQDILIRSRDALGGSFRMCEDNKVQLMRCVQLWKHPMHLTIAQGRRGLICGSFNGYNYCNEEEWHKLKEAFKDDPDRCDFFCGRCEKSYAKWQREGGELPTRLQMKLLQITEV